MNDSKRPVQFLRRPFSYEIQRRLRSHLWECHREDRKPSQWRGSVTKADCASYKLSIDVVGGRVVIARLDVKPVRRLANHPCKAQTSVAPECVGAI